MESNVARDITIPRTVGLAHATGVHERNTVSYARFALKKRHDFCAKARGKKHAKAQIRHTLGTVKARFKYC